MINQSIRGLQMADPRLNTIMERWQQHPGSMPGGTGTTGLLSNDAQGYSNMLNDNTWAQEQLTGRPMQVRFGGYPEETQTGEISTVGQGQTPVNAGALQGLQQAYRSSTGNRQAQAASELQRRFPFMYPKTTPWSLG